MGNILIAVKTWAFCPIFSSAELNAKLLITVASMPIWSPFTRSTPLEIPLNPRNMFPPPMTIPISMPMSAISLICVAYSAILFSSMPYCFSPMSDSPLSFRRILLYRLFIIRFVLLIKQSHLCKNNQFLWFT